MTGRGGTRGGRTLGSVFLLALLALQLEVSAAQTINLGSVLSSSGIPASGPASQLFDSASSSLLFSPPPPSVVPSPPPPPVATARPSPSPPPPSPPPASPPPPVTPTPTATAVRASPPPPVRSPPPPVESPPPLVVDSSGPTPPEISTPGIEDSDEETTTVPRAENPPPGDVPGLALSPVSSFNATPPSTPNATVVSTPRPPPPAALSPPPPPPTAAGPTPSPTSTGTPNATSTPGVVAESPAEAEEAAESPLEAEIEGDPPAAEPPASPPTTADAPPPLSTPGTESTESIVEEPAPAPTAVSTPGVPDTPGVTNITTPGVVDNSPQVSAASNVAPRAAPPAVPPVTVEPPAEPPAVPPAVPPATPTAAPPAVPPTVPPAEVPTEVPTAAEEGSAPTPSSSDSGASSDAPAPVTIETPVPTVPAPAPVTDETPIPVATRPAPAPVSSIPDTGSTAPTNDVTASSLPPAPAPSSDPPALSVPSVTVAAPTAELVAPEPGPLAPELAPDSQAPAPEPTPSIDPPAPEPAFSSGFGISPGISPDGLTPSADEVSAFSTFPAPSPEFLGVSPGFAPANPNSAPPAPEQGPSMNSPDLAPTPAPPVDPVSPMPAPTIVLAPSFDTVPAPGPSPATAGDLDSAPIPGLAPSGAAEGPSPSQAEPPQPSVSPPDLAAGQSPQAAEGADATPSPSPALPILTGFGPQSGPAAGLGTSSPGSAPAAGPDAGLAESTPTAGPGFEEDLAPSPQQGVAPSLDFPLSPSTLETFAGPTPVGAPDSLVIDPIAFAETALPPTLQADREFFRGESLAPSDEYPSWLAGAEEVGTDLYYVDSGNNTGFYTVVPQADGSSIETYAFATVPEGVNVSQYSPNNVELGLTGYEIYPFDAVNQAALMNQLHIALDDSSIGHTMRWNSTQNVTDASGGSSSVTGRKLLQSNSDGITSTVGSSNQTATLDVTTLDNIRVSIIVSVLPQDSDNLTSIVNTAINDGQVRRGLLEAGANVTNATVTGVTAITSGSGSSGLTPNTASPTSQSSGGVSGAVIGGAVGGGVAAIAVLAIILYTLHTRKIRKQLKDLEASPAAKITDSSSEEGYPYRRNGNSKYLHSSNGTSESGDRPRYIKTVKGGMHDVILLSNGYTGSTDSPYAHSVHPMDDRTSPDSPGWEEYRQKILTGIENAASKNQASHKIDANLWQVHWGDIKLQHEIGGGSFGKVHLAKWRETTVAVKVLSGGILPEENSMAAVPHAVLMSLQKEASLMAAMRHPNIVMYIGVCLEVPALVTEYCARGSLHDVLRKWSKRPESAVSWSRRIGMVLDAAKGMNYLHSSDPPVIHRDLKSPNLLVDKHWTIKICDFNLSRAIEESGGNVMSSLAATNPRWLAPEILSGKGYTFSSDVYSFGMILWEVLTWTVPWNDISHWQVVHMVTEQKARPDIPPEETLTGGSFSGMTEYCELMQQCWNQDPELRPKFPHIIEVLRRLMATEAGHGRTEGRASSLGTEGQSNSSALLSTRQYLNNTNNTSLAASHASHNGTSLNPSHDGASLRLSEDLPPLKEGKQE